MIDAVATDRLNGVGIVVSRCMEGARKALRFGQGPIILSPAMYSLLQDVKDDPAALERLLGAIPLMQLPAYDWPVAAVFDPPAPPPETLFGFPIHLTPRARNPPYNPPFLIGPETTDNERPDGDHP